MCLTRMKDSQAPACVDVCPTGVMKFGTRDELLKQAETKIVNDAKI